MADSKRELTFLLAGPERRLLRAIAARLPGWVTSDGLTALGVLAAAGAGAAYALSGLSTGWLWVASAMLVVNWFGDSLDGTLARVRGTERPRYGHYLDHLVDSFATSALGLGIGLSPYVDLTLALGAVVVLLVLHINVHLESAVFGVFRIAYGRIGTTELRILLILANTALALHVEAAGAVWRPLIVLANGAVAVLLVGMVIALVARFGRNLNRLARLEPARLGGSGSGS